LLSYAAASGISPGFSVTRRLRRRCGHHAIVFGSQRVGKYQPIVRRRQFLHQFIEQFIEQLFG
jgi:hypothetical protein